MPMRITVKTTPPKFEGDKPTHNISVRGPVELISGERHRKTRRFMELYGLEPFRNEDGIVTWSCRPAIGGPHLMLAATFEHLFGFAPKPELRKLVEEAFGERDPDDGLERFLGRSAPADPGDAELRVSATRTTFVANCSKGNILRQQALEAAGWLPVDDPSDTLRARMGSKPYVTRDPFVSRLGCFAMSGKNVKRLQASLMKTWMANIRRSRSLDAPENFDVPAPDGEAYLDFQKGGIAMTVEAGAGIIADDMGLGKTVQAIGIINAKPDLRSAIVFCQANMRVKFAREIEKWKTNPDLSVGYAEGSTWPDTDIVVINYDIAQRHRASIMARVWDAVIADEAHNLKNETAQRTKAVLGDILDADSAPGVRRSEGGIMAHLTGTPRPNRNTELWPLISSTRPDIWGRGPKAREIFENQFQPPRLIRKEFTKNGRTFRRIIPMAGDPRRETLLQMRLRGSGSFVRRLKRDCENLLPPKFRTSIDLGIRLSREEKAMLRDVEADLTSIATRTYGAEAVSGDSREAGAVIDAITRIDPDSPAFEEVARVRKNLGLIKAPHVARFVLSELEDDEQVSPDQRTKTVVFAHHKEVVDIIMAQAEAWKKGAFLKYDGSISSPARGQEIIDRFQDDDAIRGIVISLSGATGITLTAGARMRMAEFDWSPSNMIQIEDRIWRIGQQVNVDIGYPWIPGTMDALIGETLFAKMQSEERAINTIGFRHDADPAARPAQGEKSEIVGDNMRGFSESDVTTSGGAAQGELALR